MLITELKPTDELVPILGRKTFFILCRGCSEVCFPEEEAAAFQKAFPAHGTLNANYICNPQNLAAVLSCRADALQEADAVLVFSCGVGVQTAADQLADKRVFAACNTKILPGYASVTPSDADCSRCGECHLNLTGGICPVTACAKGLLNGQCGGAKNGRCEVDETMPCGWERIERRLVALGQSTNRSVQLRNFSAYQEERSK